MTEAFWIKLIELGIVFFTGLFTVTASVLLTIRFWARMKKQVITARIQKEAELLGRFEKDITRVEGVSKDLGIRVDTLSRKVDALEIGLAEVSPKMDLIPRIADLLEKVDNHFARQIQKLKEQPLPEGATRLKKAGNDPAKE